MGALLALAIAGCGGSGSSGSSSSSQSTAKGPISIGVLTSLTGRFQPWGLEVRDGMRFAVNQINSGGGVNGRKLQLVAADSHSQPAAGISAFKLLTEQDHVVAIGGLIDSDVGVATARLAERAQVPMFLDKAGSSAILTTSSRYTFRTCLPDAQEISAAFPRFVQFLHLTRVGAIDADYAWGQAFGSGLHAAFAHTPGFELKVEVAPVATTNFTTYLRAFTAFKPQIILATGHPPGAPQILVRSGQLGLNVPVTGADIPFSLVAKAIGKPAFGRWVDFKCMDINSPGYQNLARQFLKAFPRADFFEDDALSGYAIVNVVAQAIRSVGADPVKIAAYVHSHTFNIPGYAYPLKWTPWGELSDARLALDLLTGGPAPSGLETAGRWYPKQLGISRPLTPHTP